MSRKGHASMTRKEIEDLMLLKGWTQRQLAAALQLTEGAVSRWLNSNVPPMGPARILMRQWLDQALVEAANSKKQKQPA